MKSFEHHLINNWEYSQQFSIQQKQDEWLTFLEYIEKDDVKTILEIGAYDGGTSASLSLMCDTLFTIDIHDPPRFDINELKQNCAYTYISGNSNASDIVNFVHKGISEKIDLLFIDGDHHYELGKLDYLNYKDMVKPGGIIAFHDIIESEYHIEHDILISKLWDEIKSTYKFIEIKALPYEWGGIGIIWTP